MLSATVLNKFLKPKWVFSHIYTVFIDTISLKHKISFHIIFICFCALINYAAQWAIAPKQIPRGGPSRTEFAAVVRSAKTNTPQWRIAYQSYQIPCSDQVAGKSQEIFRTFFSLASALCPIANNQSLYTGPTAHSQSLCCGPQRRTNLSVVVVAQKKIPQCGPYRGTS